MPDRYNPSEIEQRWQARWEADGLYRAPDDDPRPKFYFLTMLPYTSGDLHIGHWYAMAPSDAAARYRRMQGYNVLFPMGFDAFGLPAENAAIKHGVHPHRWTMDNIQRMRQQLKSMGAMFDWQREVITCLPEYYRWNQWFFLKLYERGLAYRALAPVWWCPSCQTVLANEQVVGGGCERCDSPVLKRDLEQWFLRITAYADELLDHSQIDWPEPVVVMQRNWIGRSPGVEVAFGLEAPGVEEKEGWPPAAPTSPAGGHARIEREIRVFTTRPDTIYGVTFMVLAPEHPLVEKLTAPERQAEVDAYIEQARRQSEIDRLSTESAKTGVFIGAYCRNLLSGEDVPIFVADYVLLSYGTGAVMGVPAHDQRDYEFAQQYGLPIRLVIAPPGWQGEELPEAYVGPGVMVRSGPFDGLWTRADWEKLTPPERQEMAQRWGFAAADMERRLAELTQEGKEAVGRYVEERGWGRRTVSYRLRDWLISRQRYWGCPIPIVYCQQCGIVPVPEEALPVLLPEDAEFKPTGESPLARHEGFVSAPCPRCSRPARRETDTMDTFVDSNWYFIRYLSPHYAQGPVAPDLARRWLPVDQYTGGAEHAVMHLLYARFFWKALRDLGLVAGDEPFLRLFNQGQILGPDGQRMSKSRGNVVAPDEQVARYGADTFRAYLMFLGPWEEGGPFNLRGIAGLWRWLNRVWSLALEEPAFPSPPDAAATQRLRRLTHRTVKRVTRDMERFRFNTMLAALMEFTNGLYRARDEAKRAALEPGVWQEAIKTLLLLLAPTAPHLSEELWQRRGYPTKSEISRGRRRGRPYSIHQQPWPAYDEELAREEEVTLVVQVNGRVRDRLQVPAAISEEEAKTLALASPRVRPHIDGRSIARVIYVPGRYLVNVVLA